MQAKNLAYASQLTSAGLQHVTVLVTWQAALLYSTFYRYRR